MGAHQLLLADSASGGAAPGHFFRNFVDMTTTNLTAFKGTITAALGVLQGTPTSGAVHERVYFDLLPTTITGAWTNAIHFTSAGGAANLLMLLFLTQGDVSTDNTLQNGYWIDNLSGTGRMIRFTSGGGTVLASGLNIGPGANLVQIAYNGTNTFTLLINGLSPVGPIVDSTFTSGRMGMGFFSNPGDPGNYVDYTLDYIP